MHATLVRRWPIPTGLARFRRKPRRNPRTLLIAFAAITLFAGPVFATPQSQQPEATRTAFGNVTADWTWEPAIIPAPQSDIEPPVAVSTQVPAFPSADVARAGYQGHVIVEATIGIAGQVLEPRIVRSPSPDVFNAPVLAAVRQWTFRPATLEGVPTAVTGIFTFHFAIAASDPGAADQEQEAGLSGRRANAVQMGTSGLVAPRQTSTELPEYTEAAREAGIEGDVYVSAVVTTEGNVVEPELVRGMPDDELNRRALEAVTRWRFEPGYQDDQPVDVLALFTVTFRIH